MFAVIGAIMWFSLIIFKKKKSQNNQNQKSKNLIEKNIFFLYDQNSIIFNQNYTRILIFTLSTPTTRNIQTVCIMRFS